MDSPYIHSITTYLHSHPHIGLAIIFIIAFTESLPLIGAVIPGSVTMTAVGMLIGSGIMPFTASMLWAILGAFLGDFVGFWIGARYHQQLPKVWPFRNNPNWLAKGAAFFSRHGGKSVIFGRFVGPARSAVPLIAGLMQMSTRRFIIAALPSATVWALIYICPGIFIGALSLELPPHMASKFILAILAFVAFSWLIFLVIHFFFKQFAMGIEHLAFSCWNALSQSRKMRWIPRLLSYPELPFPHRQLILLLAMIISGLLACWVYIDVFLGIGLNRLNEPLFILFRSLRIHSGDIFMLIGTMIGDKFVLLPAAGLIFIYLIWKRYFWTAMHWIGLILVSAASVEVLKRLYYSPRPPGLLSDSLESSLPSGHTLLSVSFYGFLAFLIAQYLPPGKRKTPYVIAGFICLWVLLSRLYLGAHWLTDVTASVFIAITLVLLAIISYRSRPHQPLPYKRFALLASSAIVIICVCYGIVQFRQLRYNYTLYWNEITTNEKSWWENQTPNMPLYIISRLGKPNVALNIQWLGNLQDIQQTLLSQGWEEHPSHNDIKAAWRRLSARTNSQHLPLLPALYQNRGPELLLTKFDQNHQQLSLLLWRSNVTLSDTQEPLWVGNISYYVPHPHQKNGQVISTSPELISYAQAIQQLTVDLRNQQFKIIQLPSKNQPEIMSRLHWDGRILLIRNLNNPVNKIEE